jgi:polyhydroxyalkanoate synthesis regulator phasin
MDQQYNKTELETRKKIAEINKEVIELKRQIAEIQENRVIS